MPYYKASRQEMRRVVSDELRHLEEVAKLTTPEDAADRISNSRHRLMAIFDETVTESPADASGAAPTGERRAP